MNDEIDLQLASADYTDAGNIKSDKWYCKVIDAEIGTFFNCLILDVEGKIKEKHEGYNDKGVVVFTEEMTQSQAADYLNTVANFQLYGESGPLCEHDNGAISAVCVVYPWPAGHTYPDGSPYVNGPAL